MKTLAVVIALMLGQASGQTALKQPQFYGAPGDWCTSDAMFNQPQLDLGPDCYARWMDHVMRRRPYPALMPLVEPLPPPRTKRSKSRQASQRSKRLR